MLAPLLTAMLTALLAAAATLLAALTSRGLILLTGFLLATLLLAALLFATHHVSPLRKDFRVDTIFSHDVCSWNKFSIKITP
jgi:hypothetical protein